MRHNAARTDLDRQDMWRLNKYLIFCLSLLVPSLVASMAAQAGDRALAEIIGYSEDGRYFAFEEFGEQDGSGFAYSNIYIIDLAEDRWVVGTPVKMRGDDEDVALHEIRDAAYASVAPRFDDLSLHRPALTLALNGDGTDKDGQSIKFGVPGYLSSEDAPAGAGSAILGNYTLSLEVFPTKSGSPCTDLLGGPPQGFALQISDANASHDTHRDQTLPRSRGCPSGYQIYGVFVPFQARDISHAVALVSVHAFGFEGPDRRFVAVPLATGL